MRTWDDESIGVAFIPHTGSTLLLTREACEALRVALAGGPFEDRFPPELLEGLLAVGLLQSPTAP